MSLPALLVAAFLAGCALTGPGIWWVQARRFDTAELQRIQSEGRAAVRRQDVALDASVKFQASQAKADERESEVIKEVVRVISQPVYRERCLDDDGMRIIAADIQAANARRGIAPALPAASSPK